MKFVTVPTGASRNNTC